jgi:phage I-like protein
MHTLLIDEFVNVKAGEPYRLFAFGKIVKGGKVREITPEFAATIKLPHFKPAIKLGSHEDATPAGGHIVGLEIRADGLYAVPEFNDKGTAALSDGAYRYHSPEIIWEGGLEDPTSGDVISAPLIMGDALLHTPHLGEAAAMYSVEEISQENNNMNENVSIPQSLLDKFLAVFDKKQEVKEVIVEKVVEPEDYTATKTELSQYKAEQERLVAEAARKSRIEKFDAELKETKADPTLAELLADVPADTAEAVMKQFKALSAQIDESKVTGEQGTPADGTTIDPQAAFNAAVLKICAEKKILYPDAFKIAQFQHADLYNAWAGGK